MQATKDQQRLRLRLRTEEFDRSAAALLTDLPTDRRRLQPDRPTLQAIAERLGMDVSALSRQRHHLRYASAEFVAAVLHTMPGVPFERLFEVVPEASCASE